MRAFVRSILAGFILVVFITAKGLAAPNLLDEDERLKVRRQSMQASLAADSIFDPEIDWPTRAGLQQTGKICSVFDCYGVFGELAFAPPEEYNFPTAGFLAPAWGAIDYLSTGAIWVGGILGSDTLVSVGAEGWNYVFEMSPPDGWRGSSVIRIDYPPADFSMRALFTDTITEGVRDDYMGGKYKPLHIRLSNRSHVRRSDPYRDCILYDLVVTNIGADTIHGGYLGYHADGDAMRIGGSYLGVADDLSGSMRSSGIGYVVDNNGDPVGERFPEDTSVTRAFAFAFLNSSFVPKDTNFNWWVSNGSVALDFGPRQVGTPQDPFRDFGTGTLGTPLGNANQYYVMRHKEWDYDQCRVYSILPIDSQWMYPENRTWAASLSQGADTRFLVSIGPFDLAPDSSIRVQFTTFTADSIHTDPDIMQYLPYYPSAYTATLGVERLIAVADIARQFGRELLDPLLPPVGFSVFYGSADSIVYEWDPWVFPDVIGYRLLLGTASPADLPHPGVIPPWQLDIPLDSAINVGSGYRYRITGFDPNLIVVARLRNLTVNGEGQVSPSASVHMGKPPAAPAIQEYSFAAEGEPLMLAWRPSENTNIDHYNIYKFEDSAAAVGRYLPFYDTRSSIGDLIPRESTVQEGKTYYYYALDPYASVSGVDSTFVDWIEDGNTFVVTAVDQYGFESAMSAVTIAYVVAQRSRDVLILTRSSGSSPVISSLGSIEAFYDSVFAGAGLDYEVFDVRSNCISIRTCPDWRGFLPFRWIIIDDIIYDGLPYRDYETDVKGFSRYVLSGGNLVYFGGGFQSWSWISLRTPPLVILVDNSAFIRRFFGIDSLFFAGATYSYPEPVNDSLFGFDRAEAVSALPGLRCRTEAYPLGPNWEQFWTLGSPPSVSTYRQNERGTVTHTYASRYPSTAFSEGEPVGIRTSTEATDTYLFGFHLYYMRVLDARGLIGSMMSGNKPPVLSATGEEHFEVDGVYPDTGRSGTAFTFRVRYEDPEGDPPMNGYPRVYVYSAQGAASGSPFVMQSVEKEASPPSGLYTVDVTGLIPDAYSYRFEARDAGAALAGGGASAEMKGPVVQGDVWHVAVAGSDETGDGSTAAPFGSIQYAVNTGLGGDAILVHDGTYSGARNRDIDFGGKALIVRSVNGPSTSIIFADGNSSEPHRAFNFHSGEAATSIIEGFTIAGGYADSGAGALTVNSSPTFRRCVFTGNAAGSGPALAVQGGAPTLENCTIVDNTADSGGAVSMITNKALSGPVLDRCIIAFNAGVAAVSCNGDPTGISVTNCDFYQNEYGDWTGCVVDLMGTYGNFSADPMFCDAASSDYRLQSGSPCTLEGNDSSELIGGLDVGCVPTDVDGENSGGDLPESYSLSQNYPNPFNSATTVTFSIPTASHVTITVFNVLGQRVATILDQAKPAGVHTVSWDGNGPGGTAVSSGVYFYRMKAGSHIQTRKMLLVK